MSNYFHCDICGTATLLHPPYEPIFEEKEVEVKNPLTGEVVGKSLQNVPVTVKQKILNPQTGKLEFQNVQALKYLKPKTHLVILQVGGEQIQRDFCEKCYKEKINPSIKATWDFLEGIEPQ